MKYRQEIDGLRAISVIAIILFHTQHRYFSNGFIGVDVFFLISGYLITGLIVSRKKEKQFCLFDFYLARARRLLPALLLVILLCIPFAWMWMLSDQYKDFSQSLIAANLSVSNILFWLEAQDYFAASASLKPLLHTWSLSVEAQFYLIYPVILLLLLSGNREFVIPVILSLTILFIVYRLLFIHNPLTLYFMPHARFWLFGIGISVFFIRDKWELGESAYSGLLALIGFVFFVLAFVLAELSASEERLLISRHDWIYLCIAGVAMIMLFADVTNLVGRFLATRVLRGIGIISYSLYLWHYPLFSFAQLRLLTVPMSVYFLLIALSFMLAYLSWRFVEFPFRNAKRVPAPKFIAAVTISSILILSLGAYGVVKQGYVAGMSKNDRVLEPNYGLGKHCQFIANKPECQIGEEPEILVLGDSFAMHSVNTLLASKPNVSMIQLTMSACSPLQNDLRLDSYKKRKNSQCIAFNKKVLSSINQWPSLKYVVISNRFSRNFNDYSYGKLEPQEKSKYFEFIFSNLIELLNQLESQGLIPVVVSEPRRPPEEKISCAAYMLKFNGELNSCYFSSQISNAQLAANKLLRKVSSNYKVIWLDDFICSAKECITSYNGTALYSRGGHLSTEGASLIGSKLGIYQQINQLNNYRQNK